MSSIKASPSVKVMHGRRRRHEVVMHGRNTGKEGVLIVQDIQATYQRNDHYSRDLRWLINVPRLVRQYYRRER